jgi:hypothetical protein
VKKAWQIFGFVIDNLFQKNPYIKRMGWNIIGYLPQSVQGKSSTAKTQN